MTQPPWSLEQMEFEVLSGHLCLESRRQQHTGASTLLFSVVQWVTVRSGLTGVGGFIPVARLPQHLQDKTSDSVVMTFGPNGFFGYGRSSNCDMPVQEQQFTWWSTFGSSSEPSRTIPVSDIREKLLSMHSWWKSPGDSDEALVFKSIIESGCTEERRDKSELLILPRYEMAEMITWSSPSGRVVLSGDAAQVVPPDAGRYMFVLSREGIRDLQELQGKGSLAPLKMQWLILAS